MSIQLLIGDKDKVNSGLLVKSNNNFKQIITGGTIFNDTIILTKFNGETIEIPLELNDSAFISNDPYIFDTWSADTISGATRQAISNELENIRLIPNNGLTKIGNNIELGSTLIRNTLIDGDFDLTFKDNKSFNIENIIKGFNVNGLGANGIVRAIITQNDNKLIVSGTFTSYNGNTVSNNLIRLNPDGTIDNTFNSGGTGFNALASNLSIQSDGKILVGGSFTQYNGLAIQPNLIRLNSDGTIDNTFNSGGTGFNSLINTTIILPDNKILVLGGFTTYNGNVVSNRLIRLNSDGTIDNTFNSGGTGFNGSVSMIKTDGSGNIIVGGNFTTYNGLTVPARLVRLNSNGTLDTTFNSGGTGFNATVFDMKILNDNRILVGGAFITYNGLTVPARLVRLNSNGTLDTTFNSGGTGFNNNVITIEVSSDNKILVGGQFITYNGITIQSRLVRLNSNGTLDTTFNSGGTGFNNTIFALNLLSDNKILVGGQFTTYNNNTIQQGITKLNNDGLLNVNIPIKVFIDNNIGLIKYNDNYHEFYTNRTLVDKEFVETYTSSALTNYVTTNTVQNIISQKTFLSASTRFNAIEINDNNVYKIAINTITGNTLVVAQDFETVDFGNINTRNIIRLLNSSTTNNPILAVDGVDVNRGIDYRVKGTGTHRFTGDIQYFDSLSSTFRTVITNHPVNANVLDLARGYSAVFLRTSTTNGVNPNSVQATNKGLLNIPVLSDRASIYISDNFSKGAGGGTNNNAALAIDSNDNIRSINALRSGTGTSTSNIESQSTRSFRAIIPGGITYPNNFEIIGYTNSFPGSTGSVFLNTNISWFKSQFVYNTGASGNISNIRDFYAIHTGTITGNGYTILNRIGLEVDFNNAAAQNQYGIRTSINVNTLEPTQIRYNLFSTGNAPSLIQGNLELGSRLLINDTIQLRTAINSISPNILNIGEEFETVDFGNINTRNIIRLINSSTTNNPILAVDGVDVNRGLTLRTKGDGTFRFQQTTGSNPFGEFSVGGSGAGGKFNFTNEVDVAGILRCVGASTNFSNQQRPFQISRNYSPASGVTSNYIYITGNIGTNPSAGNVDAITFDPTLGVVNNGTLNRISFIRGSLMEAPNRFNLFIDGTAKNFLAGNLELGSRVIMSNSVLPSSGFTQDTFTLYATDIVAGNSAPHFRTENGDIIKLYAEDNTVTPAIWNHNGNSGAIHVNDTFDGYSIGQVITILKNKGFLK